MAQDIIEEEVKESPKRKTSPKKKKVKAEQQEDVEMVHEEPDHNAPVALEDLEEMIPEAEEE